MNTTATVIAVSVAGVCSFISLVLTFFLVFRHLRYWVDPVGQTYIVRILLMVPVYALCSWFSLLVASHTIYFNLVRDCYEAFALYQFFSLLVHYFDTAMRDHPGVEEDDDATTGRFLTYFHTRYHPYPLCFLPPEEVEITIYNGQCDCVIDYDEYGWGHHRPRLIPLIETGTQI